MGSTIPPDTFLRDPNFHSISTKSGNSEADRRILEEGAVAKFAARKPWCSSSQIREYGGLPATMEKPSVISGKM